jgi:hypothetical protein
MGPCKIKKIVPGAWSEQLPVMYDLMIESIITKIKVPEYKFEPAECEMEQGFDLAFLFTPYRQNRGKVPVHTVDKYFSLLENPSGSFPTLPGWISFLNDTFTLDSTQTSDNGFYLIFVRAEIYDPGTGELIVSDSLILEIKASIPTSRLLNIPPYFIDS